MRQPPLPFHGRLAPKLPPKIYRIAPVRHRLLRSMTDEKGSREDMPKNKPSLPSNRAFVVQLRWDAAVEQGDFRGRVEHITSMQATHFESIEELTTFIVRVIAAQPSDDE